jgi:Ca2+-transporting ATPase
MPCSTAALGVSMLPEEFPLVLTVFKVMGAWRISRAHVLTEVQRNSPIHPSPGVPVVNRRTNPGSRVRSRKIGATMRDCGKLCV